MNQETTKQPIYMVFDVESAGLHGEGFAVAGVILENGEEIDSFCYVAPLHTVDCSEESEKWLGENVLPHLPEANRQGAQGVRSGFWADWMHWKEQGAQLVTDCGWPVEANFLTACIADDPENRSWNGPYPLFDLPSILLAAGENPTETFPRLSDELPAHNPLSDARQSARVMMSALKRIEARFAGGG